MGGKNIIDHTNEQQRALEQRRKEIADQKVISTIKLPFIIIIKFGHCNGIRVINVNIEEMEISNSKYCIIDELGN